MQKSMNKQIFFQVDTTAQILNSLLKTKKPIVVATTKNDEGNEIFSREAERLLNRKEYKGIIPLVETSSHENINVDQAFFLGKTLSSNCAEAAFCTVLRCGIAILIHMLIYYIMTMDMHSYLLWCFNLMCVTVSA